MKLPIFCNFVPGKAGISWDSTSSTTLLSELAYPCPPLPSITCFGTRLVSPISVPGQPTAAVCVTHPPPKPPSQPSANSPVLPLLPPFAAWARLLSTPFYTPPSGSEEGLAPPSVQCHPRACCGHTSVTSSRTCTEAKHRHFRVLKGTPGILGERNVPSTEGTECGGGGVSCREAQGSTGNGLK